MSYVFGPYCLNIEISIKLKNCILNPISDLNFQPEILSVFIKLQNSKFNIQRY